MGVKRVPKAPPIPSNKPVTPIEAWYLECLGILTNHYRRPPTLSEMADYCKRTVFPIWQALRRLEAKGKVRQNADKRFEVR